MIKLTVDKAVLLFNALNALPALPDPQTSYHLGRCADLLEPAVKRYTTEQQKLFNEFATVDTDGKRKVIGANVEKYNEKHERLLAGEVELDKHKVKLSDIIGDTSENYPKIPPAVMRGLSPLLEHEDEKKDAAAAPAKPKK